MRLAYLLSRYPAVSHTFFLKEVLGLRHLGLSIATASVNPPDRPAAHLSDDERTEMGNTFYLKGGPLFEALTTLLGISLRHPAVLLRGLAAVAGVRGLTFKVRLFWLAYLAEALMLGAWMRRGALSHLHVHFGGPVATVGMLTSQAWRIPYSLTIHGPEELQNVSSYHLPEKLSQSSFVVCISDFSRSQLQQITPPSQWHKFTVVRLGVGQQLLQQTMQHGNANGSTNRPVHLVCVGRLVPEKGQRLLLHTLACLQQQGLEVRLTLAGDGVDRSTLEAEASALQIAGIVHFAGALSHAAVLALCATADLFVLPSFAEGIPVALMEAMALEIPCVSTTIAGIPELMRNGVDGLLVPPSNLDALAAAVMRLVQDPALRRCLGNSARARVRLHYCLPDNLQQLAIQFQERVPLAARGPR